MQDPFKDVKSLSVEIGQPTFAELISVTLTEDKAFSQRTSIRNSIPKLAFNRPNSEPGQPTTDEVIVGNQYNYSQSANIVLQKYNPIEAEFRRIVKNSVTEGNLLCKIDNNVSCNVVNSTCPIDIAFVIDDTSSMQASIDKTIEGLVTVAGYINQISNDYRMSLMTFKDCDEIVGRVPFACNNIDNIIENLKTIRPDGGFLFPEASDVAIAETLSGIKLGAWRGASVQKLLVLVTDTTPGGCNQVGIDPNNQAWLAVEKSLRDSANSALDCGIKFLIPYRSSIGPGGNPVDVAIYQEIAETTGGLYVRTDGSDIPNLLASYIFSLCGQNTVSEDPECSDNNNGITNGRFNNGIDFWDGLGASWLESEQAMRLKSQPPANAYAEQYIPTGFWTDREDIRPGTLISLGFDVKGVKGYSVKYTFIAGDNTVTGDYTLEQDFYYKRIVVYTTLPAVGVTGVVFETGQEVVIDNVFICAAPSADCPGATNFIKNPDFNEGVEFWSGDTGPLVPTDDSNYWDEDNRSAVLSIDGTLVLQQTVSAPSKSQFTFFILRNEPSDIGDLGVKVRVYKDNETYFERIIYNKDITEFPHKVSGVLTNATDVIDAIVEFTTGPAATPEGYSGYTLIRGVSLCKSTNTSCPDRTLDYTDFSAGRNGWAGGLLETDQQRIMLLPNESLTKTFTNLIPGTEATLTYTHSSPEVSGTIYSLISGPVTNSGGYAGPAKIFIQSNGTLTVKIESNRSNPALTKYYIDNISICIVEPTLCEGTVRGLQAAIEWRTMPKYPVNLITGFIKYDIRNYTDPEVRSVKYEIPEFARARRQLLTEPGQIPICNKIDTCDAWKQKGDGAPLKFEPKLFENMLGLLAKTQGGSGVPQYMTNVIEGKLERTYDPNWGRFLNYVFAIPSNKNRNQHDRCVLSTPAGGTNVTANIEKITIYLLMNQIISNDPFEYFCGPLEDYTCNTNDDAFDVLISYANTNNIQREFRVRVERNSIYTESGDITLWDQPSELGSGAIIGDNVKARWLKVEFEIDNTLGTGLDQCSKPIAPKIFTGGGELQFSGLSVLSDALFADPCDSEIIVESVSEGTSQNERQSITLPNPTGGTWTLTLRKDNKVRTATLSGKAKASQVQTALESFNTVGQGNVQVEGSGTGDDPFIVEFINELAGTDIILLEANGSNLIGSASGAVQTVDNGGVNERQKIYMAHNNMVGLTVEFNNAKSALVPYNASLDAKQAALEAMQSIGVGNILVTGDTKQRDVPYIGNLTIDFIEALGGTNLPSLVVTPESSWNAVTVYNGGGNNEKQVVTVQASGGTYRLKIYDPAFSGLLRLTLPPSSNPTISAYTRRSSAPINDDKTGIEVDGRPGLYEFNVTSWPDGDMVIDIADPAGRFCLRKVGVSYYTGTTWEEVEAAYQSGSDSSGNNGVGAPSDFDEHFWTDNINFNASASEVRLAIAAAPFIGFTNVDVTKFITDAGTHQWQIEFKNDLGSIDIRQMQIDTSTLIGGDITVRGLSNGSSTPDEQRIKIVRADAGYFTLTITVDEVEETTDTITWNTTALGLRESIAAHTKLGLSQVRVLQETPADPEVVSQFLVRITGHGNVPLMMADYQETLLCNPVNLTPVPEPPYSYPIECNTNILPPCSINDCLPGPLPSRPCDGDSPLPYEPCCETISETANIALYYKFQRDLFDPNVLSATGTKRTVKELARSKNLDVRKYNPYRRDFKNGTLESISYDTVVTSGISIILIDAQIDSNGGRYQVLRHLKNTREILPTRMIWPSNRLPLMN